MKNQQPSALSPAPRLDNALVSPDIHQKRLNGQNHAKGISNSSFDNRSPSSNNSHESHLSNDYMEGEADVFPCEGSAGRLPEEVYDRTMSRWRAAIRRKVKECVERESPVIAAMQARVRNPILDAYFVYTSFLGTHTFFMITLPALIFFGYGDVQRGLLMNLALGVYISSFVKDLVCSPRPYAPPVARLTMGNHHLEYGFPSTHSTNSVSIALYFFTLLQRLYATPVSAYPSISAAFAASANLTLTAADRATQALADGGVQETIISATTYRVLVGLLLFYVFSIVYGRLYTGMHSFTDCIMGVTLGTSIWAVYMACGGWLHAWIRDSGWVVPAVTIPVCLLLVHKHPQPVDDCPCFEDAIAFMSVVMGEILIRWFMLHHGFHDDHFFVKAMPGSDWADWVDVTTWMLMAVVKMVVGIFIVFVWRILAKALSHLVLPPIFRLLSHLFTLPHRRFYTPATDYKSVPHDKGLHPIPSVIDLPSMMELEMDGGGASGSSLGVGGYDYGGAAGLVGMKQRNGRGREKGAGGQPSDEKERVIGLGLSVEESGGRVDVVVKHYDADVLTKVFVYCGIGILACGVIPIMFELLGWGVRAN